MLLSDKITDFTVWDILFLKYMYHFYVSGIHSPREKNHLFSTKLSFKVGLGTIYDGKINTIV
jgi:hypothetical protein